jgi:methionyl-tRNA formyltransferase
MGTPEFAVTSLQALVENGWPVVAVITAPDKPKGRGQTLVPPPVKQYASEKNIPVLQPTNLKDHSFLEELKSLKANLQVVVAFRMLPEVVWDMPDLGTFNLHASLLPNYRGAAPINWAIINGESETGVTTFFLKHEIDTGSIIMQEAEPIGPDDTVGDLYERLMRKGSELIVKTVAAIANETVKAIPQDLEVEIKHAPKIFKDTCEIDWLQNNEAIHNFIRGLNPYPAAWTTILEESWKVFAVKPEDYNRVASPGTMMTDHKEKLIVKTGDGWLAITDLQMPGKRRMSTNDLLRGNPLNELETLTI